MLHNKLKYINNTFPIKTNIIQLIKVYKFTSCQKFDYLLLDKDFITYSVVRLIIL